MENYNIAFFFFSIWSTSHSQKLSEQQALIPVTFLTLHWPLGFMETTSAYLVPPEPSANFSIAYQA